MSVVIDAEFRNLIPPLQRQERIGLEARLRSEGCRDALVVWRNGKDILLDGHNRYEICATYGIPFRVAPIELESREHARLWIEENQLGRRNLTDDQRAMIAQAVMERRSALTRSSQLARAREIKAGASVEDNMASTGPKLRTRAAVAKDAKLPERKLRAAAELKRAAPELAAQVRAGEIRLADAMREVRRAEVIEKLESTDARQAKELAGLYDVIVIDRPWPMEKIERDRRPNQVKFDYPPMSIEEIKAEVGQRVKKHACNDCHVFLWATQRFLPDALRLLDAWKVRYVCTFVWHKTGGFQPIGLPQFNCEFILYARKGSPVFIDTKAFPACFQTPRGAHSLKPEAFYDTLRRVTAGRRLDMFGRRAIDGFDSWGNQAPQVAPFKSRRGRWRTNASVSQRSPFRYPGGKTWLVPYVEAWTASLVSKPAVFIEPFAGGAIVGLTVAFEKLADRVILVELDEQVAAVWRAILGGQGDWLAQRILDFDLTTENVARELAQRRPTCLREKAFQTLLKNRTFHGGILAPGSSLIKHGENGKGLSSRWYPETLARRILDIVRIKDRIEIIEGDGIAIMSTYAERRDVAFFIDPPYTAAGKRAGTRLYTHYTLDHDRLFETAARLAGPFLITYDNAPELVALATKHSFQTRTIPMKNTHHALMDELVIGRDLTCLD